MIKICTVVIGYTMEEFLTNLEEVQKISEFVELRVDYIHNLSIEDLDIIRKKTYRENIFTCRTRLEGGKFLNEENVLHFVYRANELNFDYVDIEMSKLKHVNFTDKKSRIIGSYHNFTNTPSYAKLEAVYNEIISYNFVDIAKIATNVTEDDDNINLIKLILHKKTDIIVLGMGEKGKVVRIVSSLMGSYLTFASSGSSVSAPGQISLPELKEILNL